MPTPSNDFSALHTSMRHMTYHLALTTLPSLDQICGTEQLSLLKDMGHRPAVSSQVAAPLHQWTEATFAKHLALTTASVIMQSMSGGIIFYHACRQIMDSGATGVTVLTSTLPYDMYCFIFITHSTTFKLFSLQCFASFNKVQLLTSKGSAETYISCGWRHFMCFVANFIGLPAVKKFEDRLTIGRVMASYMRKVFMRHHVVTWCWNGCWKGLRLCGPS